MGRYAPVTVRIDPAVKSEAAQILGTYGLTMSQAINIYLHKIILERGLPFDLRPADDTTRRASAAVKAGSSDPAAVDVL